MYDRLDDDVECVTIDTGHDVRIEIKHKGRDQRYTTHVDVPFSRYGLVRTAKFESMRAAERHAISLAKQVIMERIGKLQDALESLEGLDGKEKHDDVD